MSKDFNSAWLQSRELKKVISSANIRVASHALESDLHKAIEAELKRRRWYYVHSRMDKRTTTQLGVTDFIVAIPGGKTLWCEAKRKGGKLSQEQNITRHILLASGHWHEVVYSIEQFNKLIDTVEIEKGTE